MLSFILAPLLCHLEQCLRAEPSHKLYFGLVTRDICSPIPAQATCYQGLNPVLFTINNVSWAKRKNEIIPRCCKVSSIFERSSGPEMEGCWICAATEPCSQSGQRHPEACTTFPLPHLLVILQSRSLAVSPSTSNVPA